ncbi:MurR/RpiR family transcriptional regulator [Latilactobacillus graminis]|uniref:Helix-turn-helix domain, rpiR family protein n=2 Tax=Latilactobacillus graminis TaxID=60519 RepID=A0AA89I7N4_9LACO|nr:MurR/RpiR family transcriptional regulator [Latilactobacillus graminis]KRM24582.1 helix-turn-helix domain, rpiR family protein [Latilactobacillus graminis DSM 20719]QFP78965.1 MurR/RpiR family transcriptional regulator [Latilactobacillus graminis]
MFELEKIQRLNTLDLSVLKYVLNHRAQVEKMTIRQLATQAHVSTSTISRFCEKLGCEGFSEFKYMLKQERLAQKKTSMPEYDVILPITEFLDKTNNETFRKLLSQATALILESQAVFFFGIGTSGALAQYGSRYLANVGIFSLSINDPFTPMGMQQTGVANTLLVVLSVSGETPEVLTQVEQYRLGNGKVLAITNSTHSTLARLADIVIPYYMPEEKNGSLNNTTQLPVIYILELLAHRIACAN